MGIEEVLTAPRSPWQNPCGVTSGLDLGLHLVGRIAGSPGAEGVAVEMEIVRGRVYLGPRAPLRTDA